MSTSGTGQPTRAPSPPATTRKSMSPSDEIYSNVPPTKPSPAVSPKDTATTSREWDILTGYLHMSVDEAENIANDMLKVINPPNEQQYEMCKAAILGRVSKTSFEAVYVLVKKLDNKANALNKTDRKDIGKSAVVKLRTRLE